MGLEVVFRTDASLAIGTGHVMRCLTLADRLAAAGATCRFVARPHPGHLLDAIRQRGFAAVALPPTTADDTTEADTDAPAHAAWLQCRQQTDARQTLAAIGEHPVDWLVVDHYALDRRWESRLRPACRHLMAIDDLADRVHDCDLLLDQNLGRSPADYAQLTPPGCRILAGPGFALLRPEFAALREHSRRRRVMPRPAHVLIAMGGVDKDNATGCVLDALRRCPLPDGCRLTVVMGAHAPWLAAVRRQAEAMPWPTEVRVDVRDMAALMADSDLAIGAAGGSAWERCSLGLPTILFVLAENQRAGAAALAAAGAAVLAGAPEAAGDTLATACARLLAGDALRTMSAAAGALTDGSGCARVVAALLGTGAPA